MPAKKNETGLIQKYRMARVNTPGLYDKVQNLKEHFGVTNDIDVLRIAITLIHRQCIAEEQRMFGDNENGDKE